jgi:ATP/ADP translocase
MLVALVGTRKIVEIGGLRLSLSVLPMFGIAGVLMTFLTAHVWGDHIPASKHHAAGLLPNLWVTQISIICMNTFGYGLNGPSREMLYVQTARDMKYKAKSWSDMYGNSGMKSFASIINAYYNSKYDPSCGLTSIIASVWVGVWLLIAQWVGNKHKTLFQAGKIVGEKGEGKLCSNRPGNLEEKVLS